MIKRNLFLLALAMFALLAVSSCSQEKPKQAQEAFTVKGGQPVASVSGAAVRAEEDYLRRASAPLKSEGSFEDCLKAIEKRVKINEATRQCRLREKDLRQQALASLIQQSWIINEARDSGVELSPRQVRSISKQPKDVRRRVRNNYLFFQLSRNASVKDPDVDQLKKIYQSTKTIQIVPPERKAIVFVADNQPTVEAAYKLLKRGKSPKEIVALLDFDEATESSDGIRVFSPPATNVGADIAPPPDPLQPFILSLPINKSVLPQIIGEQYILARVIEETKPRKRSFSEAQPLAREISVQSQRSQATQSRLVKKWRPLTRCGRGWVVSPACGNFVAAKPAS